MLDQEGHVLDVLARVIDELSAQNLSVELHVLQRDDVRRTRVEDLDRLGCARHDRPEAGTREGERNDKHRESSHPCLLRREQRLVSEDGKRARGRSP